MKTDLELWRPAFPWRPSFFNEMQRAMDAMENETEDMMFKPDCDIEEGANYFLARFDVPGVSKDDIKIEVSGTTLYVTGERKEERREKKGTSRINETRYGRFERTFTLPAKIEADKVEATVENGVLSVYIPKMAEAHAKQIKIGEDKGFLKGLFAKKSEKEAQKVNVQ